MANETYYNQTILFLTSLFGKAYFWMKDVDGTIYLVKAKERKSISIGADGTQEEVIEGYIPDFS